MLLITMANLEPDTITIPGQNYALISVVSPTSNQKHKECALKIKGVFDTVENAQNWAKKLQQVDGTFDIFLVKLYEWGPIPPNLDMIENQQYQEEVLNEIIQGHKDEQIRAKQFFNEHKDNLMNQKGENVELIEESPEEKELDNLTKKVENAELIEESPEEKELVSEDNIPTKECFKD